MAKINPAVGISKRTDAEWLDLARKAQRKIKAKIAKGVDPELAVREAFKEAGYNQKVEDYTVKAISQAMTSGIQINPALSLSQSKPILLGSFYDTNGVSLSSRIWDSNKATRQEVEFMLRSQFRANKAWTSAAQNIHDAIPPSGDIPKVFGELNQLGRKAIGGDLQALAEYRKTLALAEQQVERLSGIPVSTERLKSAYQDAISKLEKSIDKKSIELMDKAIERAMFEKARYNAMRITRTETARAHFDGVKARILDDNDIVGFQIVLSTSHGAEDYDICDMVAEADLHGMGEGVYPKQYSPQLPLHPHCMCTAIPVASADIASRQPDNEAAISFIDNLGEKEKIALMGKSGYEMYQENPNSWQNYIKNFQGYEANSVSSEAEKIYNME